MTTGSCNPNDNTNKKAPLVKSALNQAQTKDLMRIFGDMLSQSLTQAPLPGQQAPSKPDPIYDIFKQFFQTPPPPITGSTAIHTEKIPLLLPSMLVHAVLRNVDPANRVAAAKLIRGEVYRLNHLPFAFKEMTLPGLPNSKIPQTAIEPGALEWEGATCQITLTVTANITREQLVVFLKENEYLFALRGKATLKKGKLCGVTFSEIEITSQGKFIDVLSYTP